MGLYRVTARIPLVGKPVLLLLSSQQKAMISRLQCQSVVVKTSTWTPSLQEGSLTSPLQLVKVLAHLDVVELLVDDSHNNSYNCLSFDTDWYSQLDKRGGNQQEADLASEPPGVNIRCC